VVILRWRGRGRRRGVSVDDQVGGDLLVEQLDATPSLVSKSTINISSQIIKYSIAKGGGPTSLSLKRMLTFDSPPNPEAQPAFPALCVLTTPVKEMVTCSAGATRPFNCNFPRKGSSMNCTASSMRTSISNPSLELALILDSGRPPAEETLEFMLDEDNRGVEGCRCNIFGREKTRRRMGETQFLFRLWDVVGGSPR